MVGLVIILVGFQHDLYTLLCSNKLVIRSFSVAQNDSGFIDPRGQGFFDILSTWIPPIDTTYNDVSVPVSSNAYTVVFIRKTSF